MIFCFNHDDEYILLIVFRTVIGRKNFCNAFESFY